ncbi:SEC14-like protein 2 [Caerostris darwini]|uniref:SEC14-like protein 2 n=1 Tax=Caerostris darwini TaxID=1538125 RepID=A0AAV4TY18_9ARAC|nr:SEC14-like protein 2 [Caerostris darwini]
MTVTTELTNDQKEAITELRKRVKDVINPTLYEDTHLFYRFLKARDFNLKNSEEMLRKHIQWRKEFLVDTILDDYTSVEALVKHFPGNLIGFDKEQCPVKYFAFGNMDAKGIRKAAKFSDIIKFMIQMQEQEMVVLKEQSEKVGKILPGSVYICDFKDMTFSAATDKKTLEHSIYLSKMYQDHYPERLKAVYLINVSSYFHLLFNILKVFLAASILSKMHFCSKAEVQEKLLKVIEADQLPGFLGGNRTDPDGDPLCKSFVNHAGKVPSKYFVNKTSINFSKLNGVQKLIVNRSSYSEIEVNVEEPGSLIEWEFEIKSKDIGFGLYYREMNGENSTLVEIVPLQRVDTEEFSETGIHKADKKGTYVIRYDNSYSWMRSKELFYRVIVKNPKTLDEEISLE